MNAASAGDTVKVHKGTYNEQVTLKDGVDIEGDGNETVVDGTGHANGIVGNATIATGLELRHLVVTKAGGAGIRLDGSKNVVVREMTVTANGAQGLYQTGGSGLVLRESRANGNAAQGFWVANATVTVEHNRAEGNGLDGFRIDASTAATVAHNHATANKGLGGFHFGQGSVVTSEDNEAEGNGTRGFTIDNVGNVGGNQTNVTSKHDEAEGNAGVGVFIAGSVLTARELEAEENGSDGIDVTAGGTLNLTKGEAEENAGDGIVVVGQNSTATLEDSESEENTGNGLAVFRGGYAEAHSSEFEKNKLNGVLVSGGGGNDATPGAVLMHKSESEENGGWGVLLEAGFAILGDLADPDPEHHGLNEFEHNKLGALANHTTKVVKAQNNDWEADKPAKIDAEIDDCHDNPAWGCVIYVPYRK